MKQKQLPVKGHVRAVVTTLFPPTITLANQLLAIYSEWLVPLNTAASLFNFYSAYRQERINEFIQGLIDNPDVFRKEIIESEEFQDGFVIMYQEYLKNRTKEKRDITMCILLDFTESAKKLEFPMEQLSDVLFKISPESIRILAVIQKEIIPQDKRFLFENLDEKHSVQRIEMKPISTFVQQWLYDEYNPNGKKMRIKHGDVGGWSQELRDKTYEVEKLKNYEFYEGIDELTHLGILRVGVEDNGTWNETSDVRKITRLGWQFLKYLSQIEKEALHV